MFSHACAMASFVRARVSRGKSVSFTGVVTCVAPVPSSVSVRHCTCVCVCWQHVALLLG